MVEWALLRRSSKHMHVCLNHQDTVTLWTFLVGAMLKVATKPRNMWCSPLILQRGNPKCDHAMHAVDMHRSAFKRASPPMLTISCSTFVLSSVLLLLMNLLMFLLVFMVTFFYQLCLGSSSTMCLFLSLQFTHPLRFHFFWCLLAFLVLEFTEKFTPILDSWSCLVA